LCQQSLILPVTEPIVVRAADIYAYLRRQGQLISDADILIAATALHHGLVLVTNNLPHFQRIPNLPISNWAQ
jgi:tRNA(fMet)-specific endonuclease VapC